MEQKEKLTTLEQGLKILQLFNEEVPSHTISSVSKIHNISRSTARRYLLTFAGEGYLKFDGKNFFLSSKVLDFAYNYLSINNISTIVAPYLKELTQSTNEPSGLATLDGSDIKYLGWNNYNSVWKFRRNLEIGARLPAFCTSMGRVLLSFLTEHEIQQFKKEFKPHSFTKYTQTSLDSLNKNINFVRKNGYSVMNQELTIGISTVAVPIYDNKGSSFLALNIAVEHGKYDGETIRKKIVPKMAKIAVRISEDIKLHSNSVGM